MTDLTNSFKMKSIDTTDDPFTLMKIFENLGNDLPAFINVRVNREFCHSGIEKTRKPKWDRFSIVKTQLIELGYSKEIKEAEKDATIEMKTLWKNYL